MEGQKKTADGLVFLQSPKELRVVDRPVDPHCYKLITAAHHHRLIFVALDNQQIGAIPNNEILNPQTISSLSCLAVFTLQVTFRPTIISVAQNGFSSLLMVVGIDDSTSSPMMEFFDIDARKSVGKLALPDEYRGTEIIDYAWHPKYHESILALCTRRGDLLIVMIKRQDSWATLVYKEKQYLALTCCWSPKGKNLAIGTVDGQIMRLEPVITASTFTFKEVEKSRILLSNNCISPKHKIIKLRWVKAKLLICVHAKLDNQEQPDTVYSVFTLDQPASHLFWTKLCFEQNLPNVNVQLINLSSTVICIPSSSGEIALLGTANEVKANDPVDWNSIIVDEEGARIELPLDENNQETFPRGVTVAFPKNATTNPADADRPVLIFYTSRGSLVSYTTIHPKNNLKLPALQPPLECPMNIPKPIGTSLPTQTLSFDLSLGSSLNLSKPLSFASLSAAASSIPTPSLAPSSIPASIPAPSLSFAPIPAPTPTPAPVPVPVPVPAPTPALSFTSIPPPSTINANTIALNKSNLSIVTNNVTKEVNLPNENQIKEMNLREEAVRAENYGKKLSNDIGEIRKKIEFNEMFLTLLDDINHLRGQMDEVQDIHKTHREVLEAIKLDIDSLDFGMLENLYLIEYIKSRSKGGAMKKSIDPMTAKKVEAIRQRLKVIAEKLRDLDVHVEVAWEDFVRRKNAMGSNKKRSLNSLDIIYKTLSTNQKILNVLKKKVSLHPPAPKSPEIQIETVSTRRELDPSKMRAFKEFLAARNEVPVRRPEVVRSSNLGDTSTCSNSSRVRFALQNIS